MTDEQIKQNAEEYAKKATESLVEKRPAYIRAYKAYLAGAHSRDEEVRQLHDVINDYSETIEKLRNPWISVEERLPEKTKGVFSCQVRELEKDKIVYYKDTRGYIHTGYLNAKNHWRDLDRDNAAIFSATHWMPIPKGGEV